MKVLVAILCVVLTLVEAVTVVPNGNSPEIKMLGGMMVDVQKGFVPMTEKTDVTTEKTNYEKSRQLNLNSTKLSINERYRRLIPYMTFYYANDLTPTTEAYSAKNIEVQKALIVEGATVDRQPKKIIKSPYRYVPRYQGNRLTNYNIALANPTKVYKEETPIVYQAPVRVTPNYNPFLEYEAISPNYNRFPHKQHYIKSPSVPFSAPIRKPYFNLFHNDDSPNIRYYSSEKEAEPKYKLVPYEQTPPVKVVNYENYDFPKKSVQIPVVLSKGHPFAKPRPVQPQYLYEDVFVQPAGRKQPSIVSESYYEKVRPQVHDLGHSQPVTESGFKPIMSAPVLVTEAPVYASTAPEPLPQYESEKQQMQFVESVSVPEVHHEYRPNYYQYVVDPPTYNKPAVNSVTLSDLLNSLQLNKSIPKPITRENVGSSIRTLLQVLNALKAVPQQNEVAEVEVALSTPKPFGAPEVLQKPVVEPTEEPIPQDVEFSKEPYLAPVEPPSQHIDDYPRGSTSQRFPLQTSSDDEGGTPGRPGLDYPVLTVIPPTKFDCKTQRYKGFFADPETRCQVWHYCDLNGGQASFLCPNGTIFSQAGLTCDWWFNNHPYKYILPHSPKFPEDYSGPLVDKYLTLKFKEMEDEFRKNKNKQTASEKQDTEEESGSEESSSNEADVMEKTSEGSVSEASVVVDSPGSSGNVERLQD